MKFSGDNLIKKVAEGVSNIAHILWISQAKGPNADTSLESDSTEGVILSGKKDRGKGIKPFFSVFFYEIIVQAIQNKGWKKSIEI